MKKILFSFLFLFLFTSCDFLRETDNYVESINFISENYNVYEDNLVACTLKCTPTDCFNFYQAEFSLGDEEICRIVQQDERSVVVQGLKKGSTILNARVGNKKCFCIINVIGE